LVCDAHPGYSTYRWARRSDLPLVTVQHHQAHAAALAGEHPGDEPMLVFAWDGAGMGEDGSLWGGETLSGLPGSWQRVMSMRPYYLPGGERAGREPWRSAAALCWEIGQDCPVEPMQTALVRSAWERRLNAPESSAVGRLFDAAAALVLGTDKVSYEGQGPMQLEALAQESAAPVQLPIQPDENGLERVDWSPLVPLLSDPGLSRRQRAEIFHSSLAHNILAQARRLRARSSISRVGLTGGVFQNRRLVAETSELLQQDGFTVLLNSDLPCNDGGLAFGQIIEAAARAGRGNKKSNGTGS
jgi:hydrogenase maturation protein HypF